MEPQKTIMVIDDMANMRNILRFNLEKKGYKVVDYARGADALAALDDIYPDLIVLDIMMPKMDGYEVLQHIRRKESSRDIPVIFLTAKSQKKDVLKGVEAGGDDYVIKPYRFNTLHEKINKLLKMHPRRPQVDPPERTLAAIMITDIPGFSNEMEKDEAHTYRKLMIHNEIMRKNIKANRGQEIKTIGDAFMVQFQSAVHAVRAAARIQMELTAYNQKRAEKDRILVRIGIHLGDIFVVENDVYGNGVNVASRLEAIAEPGKICISENVYTVVKNIIDMKVTGLGKKDLKNIEDSPELYMLDPCA
ncbi:MAG: response regulator [Deltaproteobacteria bacterium]|nr:response regulator [Deltaproteobacteria bacterium]